MKSCSHGEEARASKGEGLHAHCQSLTARSGCGMSARWRPSWEQMPAMPPGDPLGFIGYCSVGFPSSSAQCSGTKPLALILAWSSGEENAMYPGSKGDRKVKAKLLQAQPRLQPLPCLPQPHLPHEHSTQAAQSLPSLAASGLARAPHARWPIGTHIAQTDCGGAGGLAGLVGSPGLTHLALYRGHLPPSPEGPAADSHYTRPG